MTTEHVTFVVDPMEELGAIVARCEDRLRWVEPDTDDERQRLLAAADDVHALGWHLYADRFSPTSPAGVELAPVATLLGDWRQLIDRLAATVPSSLAPPIPTGTANAFQQLQRSARWSEQTDADALHPAVNRTLGRRDCTFTEVEFKAYRSLVRATLTDPLERWVALGTEAYRPHQAIPQDDPPDRLAEPGWGVDIDG